MKISPKKNTIEMLGKFTDDELLEKTVLKFVKELYEKFLVEMIEFALQKAQARQFVSIKSINSCHELENNEKLPCRHPEMKKKIKIIP